MNDDPDQPLFGVGRRTVRRTQADSFHGDPGHLARQSASPDALHKKASDAAGDSPPKKTLSISASPVSAPRQTMVGAVLKKFSSKGSAKEAKAHHIVFDDSGVLEKISEYLKQGGDPNHVFTGKDPWAFLYGEKPSLLIAACYWKRPHQAEIVQLLLDHGASTQWQTTMGFSALDIVMDLHPDWPEELKNRLR